MGAYGSFKAGQSAKAGAQLDAALNAQRAQLANFDADQSEAFGKLNADMILTVSGINTGITKAVSDLNVDLINTTTDFNVGIIRATGDFNVASAEGAARLLEARGALAAGVHEANAQLADIQGDDALEAGNQAERQSRGQYAQLKSQQRVRLAANGVTLDEGSSLRIQSDTDYASDVDADVIKTNAMKVAMGYRINAANERASASFASLDGKAAALQKRAEATAAKIDTAVGVTQARFTGAIKAADTKMTASFAIMQERMNARIEAQNTLTQSKNDAWNKRAQATGYQGQAAQSRLTAKGINPALLGGTSLLNGAAQVAGQWYGMRQAGVF